MTTLRRRTRTTPTAPTRPVEDILREIAYALHVTRRVSRDDLPAVSDDQARKSRSCVAHKA
jgi:hypothetical protein